MKRCDGFKTLDGTFHESLERATKHAENTYGLALSKHAHALAQLSKYSEFMAWLDANASELAYLPTLRDDATPPKMRRSECSCALGCDRCED